MAFPPGIKTATLSFGSAVNAIGTAKPISVDVTPVFAGEKLSMVHAATGTIITAETIQGMAGEGATVNLVVPIDQAGFRTVNGEMITVGSIAYRCTVRVGSATVYTRLVHPTVEDKLYDVDMIPDAVDVLKQLGSIPLVTSVNGMTGEVIIATGGTGAGGNPDVDAIQRVTSLEGRVQALENTPQLDASRLVPTGGQDSQVLTSVSGSGVWKTPAAQAPAGATAPAGTKLLVTFDFTSAGTARPTSDTGVCVRWRGPVQPSNMVTGDEWYVTA